MNLEDACTAAWKRARERCASCHGETDYMDAPLEHSCYGDIEAVKAVAQAALDNLDLDRQIPAVKAELESHLEVKHER
jgi:hypothetical protein